MTKIEYGKCEKLMEEAIINGEKAREEFLRANKANDKYTFELSGFQAQNHFGYAEGINQVLVTLGFKHDRMKKLSDLL